MRTKRVETPSRTIIGKGDILRYGVARLVEPAPAGNGFICGVAGEEISPHRESEDSKVLIHDDMGAVFFHPVMKEQTVTIVLRGKTCDIGGKQIIDIKSGKTGVVLIVDVDLELNGVYWQMNPAKLVTESV